MKITLEIPDPPSTPKPETKDASPEAGTEAQSPPEAGKRSNSQAEDAKRTSKSTTPAPTPRTAKAVAEQQPQSEEPPAPEASSSSLHSFDVQGGINSISDPNRSHPNVFRFVMPKGEV